MPRSPPSPAPAPLSPPRRYGDRSRRGGSLARPSQSQCRTLSPEKGLCSPPQTPSSSLPAPRTAPGRRTGQARSPLTLPGSIPALPSSPDDRAGSARSGSLRTASHPARILPPPLLWGHGERRGGYEPGTGCGFLPETFFLKQIKGVTSARALAFLPQGWLPAKPRLVRCPAASPELLGSICSKKKKKKDSPTSGFLVNRVVGAGLGGGSGTMALLN